MKKILVFLLSRVIACLIIVFLSCSIFFIYDNEIFVFMVLIALTVAYLIFLEPRVFKYFGVDKKF